MFALDEVCFTPEFRFSRSSMRRFAEARRARVVIAEAEGVLAGFVIVHLEKMGGTNVSYVVTLDVAPDWRRLGLAARLMHEAELASTGCAAMLLHVFTGNEDAIRFYERLGFERSHTEEAFYGEGLDAFVYRKRLDPAQAS
ncbi:GNAT family N-acetyltransferase [Granulicella cerasi]|nr:GNAT family N-acetyltransferase [Granulicella cerasi]